MRYSMINQNVLTWFTLMLFCLLLAAPVLAATAVECPSTCSCLLPGKAKELGYATYCYGKQMQCNDDPKNPMYCYTKPTTTIPVLKQIVTMVTTTRTGTPAPVMYPECSFGCLCTREVDANAKGLVTCDRKKTLCGYDKDQTPLYCYSLPVATPTTPHPVITLTPVTTTAAPLFAPNYTPTAFTTPVDPSLLIPVRCLTGFVCMSPTEANATWAYDPPEDDWEPCGYSGQYQEAKYCYPEIDIVTLETTRESVLATDIEWPEPSSARGPYQAGFTPAGAHAPSTTPPTPLSGAPAVLALALSMLALAFIKR
jgi:hypothetical protein